MCDVHGAAYFNQWMFTNWPKIGLSLSASIEKTVPRVETLQ